MAAFLPQKQRWVIQRKANIYIQPTKPKIFTYLSGPLQIKPADPQIRQRGEMADWETYKFSAAMEKEE